MRDSQRNSVIRLLSAAHDNLNRISDDHNVFFPRIRAAKEIIRTELVAALTETGAYQKWEQS